jgi:hypothetical protein
MADNNTVTLIVALGAAIGGGVIGFVSNLTLERLRARREDRRRHRIAQETAARELRDLCYQATDTAEALRKARAAEASPPRRPTQMEAAAAGLGLTDPLPDTPEREARRHQQTLDGLLRTIERQRQDLSDKRLRAIMRDVTTALGDWDIREPLGGGQVYRDIETVREEAAEALSAFLRGEPVPPTPGLTELVSEIEEDRRLQGEAQREILAAKRRGAIAPPPAKEPSSDQD